MEEPGSHAIFGSTVGEIDSLRVTGRMDKAEDGSYAVGVERRYSATKFDRYS